MRVYETIELVIMLSRTFISIKNSLEMEIEVQRKRTYQKVKVIILSVFNVF
jgi:hypothetical protein